MRSDAHRPSSQRFSTDAPKLEPALFTHAATLIAPLAADAPPEFHGPSIQEFLPEILFSLAGVPIHRIHLIQFLATLAVVLVFWLGTRRMKVVPGRFQSIVEMGLDFVRVNIGEDLLGKKDAQRFLPILTTMFFMILFMNITGIIPFLNIAGTSIIAVPLTLAIVSYITFIYAGIKKSPKNFFKNSLFPSGVPWPIYIIVTPIELISTFIIRPVTLTLHNDGTFDEVVACEEGKTYPNAGDWHVFVTRTHVYVVLQNSIFSTAINSNIDPPRPAQERFEASRDIGGRILLAAGDPDGVLVFQKIDQ